MRSRVSIEVIGSATALSKQLAALYNRENQHPTLVVYDGDQLSSENDNLRLAKKMAENTDDDFDDWFKDKVFYMPGNTWPEAWIVQQSRESIEYLAGITGCDSDTLSDILEYGLGAGKHKEFFEIGRHLGLSQEETLYRFCINISQNHADNFEDLISKIEHKLNPGSS